MCLCYHRAPTGILGHALLNACDSLFLRLKRFSRTWGFVRFMYVYSLGALGSILVAVVALNIGIGEARLMRLSELADFESFDVLRRDFPDRSRSLHGDRLLLHACEDVLGGRLGEVIPEAALTEIADRCDEAGRAVQDVAPTWAFAYLVTSVAAYHLGDIDRAADDLVRSQSLGPYESWLAERRVKHAMRFPAAHDLGETWDTDLQALLESPLGREFLARVYAEDTGQRERISGHLETLSGELQRDFLRRVQEAGQRARQL